MKNEEKILLNIHQILQQLGIDPQKFQQTTSISSSPSTPRSAQLSQKQ
ncbi:hypothetical protein [Paenibacillus sp. N3.4]|nr:hypothetical protein [Paenibacillus sp. N3.4]